MMRLREATPTARKPHRCDWCYGLIQAGEKYHRSTNIHDDRLYDWVACLACEALCPVVWEWAYRPDEGIGEDSFYEWAHEHRQDPTHGLAALAYLHRRGLAVPCACGEQTVPAYPNDTGEHSTTECPTPPGAGDARAENRRQQGQQA